MLIDEFGCRKIEQLAKTINLYYFPSWSDSSGVSLVDERLQVNAKKSLDMIYVLGVNHVYSYIIPTISRLLTIFIICKGISDALKGKKGCN